MDDSDCELDSKIKTLHEKVSEITTTNVKSSILTKKSALLSMNVIKLKFLCLLDDISVLI